MNESEARETCSINACPRPATQTERGPIGHWYFTVFYCDEHYRQAQQGTPLGGVGIDPAKVRIEAPETSGMPEVTNRFPGIG